MKIREINLKTIIISLVIGAFFVAGYILAIFTYPSSTEINISSLKITPTPTIEQRPSYIVNIPAKYFDPDEIYDGTKAPYPGNIILFGGNLEITNPPVAIDRPTNIEVVDEEFKFGHLPITKSPLISSLRADIDNDGVVEESLMYDDELIDIDNDGKKEKILYGSVAMTHQHHKAIIIKNGRIIYKSEAHMSIGIGESASHNGFYLYEKFDIGEFPLGAGRRITRFIHEDGKFIPVWYRETFDLQTTQP